MRLLFRAQAVLKHPYAIHGCLLLLLLAYLVFSFIQHYNIPLLGDLCRIIVPSETYQVVLDHPFGLPALLEGETYPATNRFVAHWAVMTYYHHVPGWLQTFMEPVASLYAATAIAKTVIHGGLLMLMARFAIPRGSLFQRGNLAVMLLIAPLFQVNGYNLPIGVIDKSIAYTINYAGSLLFVGIFFIPFRQGLPSKKDKIPWPTFIAGLLLAITLAFMGPMNAPVLLLVMATLVLLFLLNDQNNQNQAFPILNRVWRRFWSLNPKVFIVFAVAFIAAIYSLYLGQFNAEDQVTNIPLLARFERLPEGFSKMFFSKPGPGFLLGFLLLNSLLIKHFCSQGFKKWYFRLLGIFIILALIFTLLLPYGGYRDYRPLIIRRDTYTPVLLGLFFLFGIGTYHLLKTQMQRVPKVIYALIVGAFLFMMLEHDKPGFKKNNCEQYALRKIKNSPKDTVELHVRCSVLSWGPFNHRARSEIKSEALKIMGVLKEDKRFYHVKNKQ